MHHSCETRLPRLEPSFLRTDRGFETPNPHRLLTGGEKALDYQSVTPLPARTTAPSCQACLGPVMGLTKTAGKYQEPFDRSTRLWAGPTG